MRPFHQTDKLLPQEVQKMNKYLKISVSICLIFCLTVSGMIAFGAERPKNYNSDGLHIKSVEDFLFFAKNCRLDSYSENLNVYLDVDLDLSDDEFSGVPTFSGNFEGNSHTIDGLSITQDGSVKGLFRYLTKSACVKNLNVKGKVTPGGSGCYVGGIAGNNAGKIENCTFQGEVAGTDYIGGIAGVNTVMGIIDGCSVSGSVYGDHFVGGMAGENRGTVRCCLNSAEINVTEKQNTVELSDISLGSITGSESAGTVTDIGGIAGTSSGVIRDCGNLGTVGYLHMGYNVGGIAGSQTGYIADCVNHGKIYARKDAGGIAGQMEPSAKIKFSIDTLQLLQKQLSKIYNLSHRIPDTAEEGGEEIHGKLKVLGKQVEKAYENVSQYIPEELKKPNTGTVPPKVTKPGNVTIPDKVTIPDRVTIPDEITIPDSITVPEDISLPDSVSLPSEVTIPETVTIPKEITIPDSITIPDKVTKPDYIPDEITKPDYIPDEITKPDPDTVEAVRNSLSADMSKIYKTMLSIKSSAEKFAGPIYKDFQVISKQIDAMASTISNPAANIGAGFSDISDKDTKKDTAGKVENCRNLGAVSGDLNAGGITGVIAFENDLDAEEDWDLMGQASMNFKGEIRAVILNCKNSAPVAGIKRSVGGIVGYAAFGLVKECVNAGKIDASGAEYVGGIAGDSAGFLRADSAKCELSGKSSVGGIAGRADVVTDCRSMINIENATEKTGSVIGAKGRRPMSGDMRDEIKGNFYLVAKNEFGGIDGIDYKGVAASLDKKEFLALPKLNEIFFKSTITFVGDDGNDRTVCVPTGASLNADDIPDVPIKDGYNGRWENIDKTDLSSIYFDLIFYPVYDAYQMTVQSRLTRYRGKPVLMAQGNFRDMDNFELEELESLPDVDEKEKAVEGWVIPDFSVDKVQLRYLLSKKCNVDSTRIMIKDENGVWRNTEFIVRDSYVVFSANGSDDAFCAVSVPKTVNPWAVVAGVVSAAAVLACVIVLVKKHSKRNEIIQSEESGE